MSTRLVLAPQREPMHVEGFFGLQPQQRFRTTSAVVLAMVTVAVEVASYAGWLPSLSLGRITMSTSVVPAALLVAVLGRAVLGRTQREHLAMLYWGAALAAVLSCMVAYRTLHHSADLLGLVLATSDEELVYRLAVPALVAAVLCVAGVRRNRAWVLGFAAGGVWFVLLPGHRAQWSDLSNILAFAAFAAVMAFVVWRSGSVAAAAITHLCADLVTILAWNDVLAHQQRSAVLGVVMVLLVVTYGLSPLRHRAAVSESDEATVIDLRAGLVPTVRHGDAAPVPLADERTPTRTDLAHHGDVDPKGEQTKSRPGNGMDRNQELTARANADAGPVPGASVAS